MAHDSADLHLLSGKQPEIYNKYRTIDRWMVYGVSTIFQLYRDGKFY